MTRSRQAQTDTIQTIIGSLAKRIDNLERSPMNLLQLIMNGAPIYGIIPNNPNYVVVAGSSYVTLGASGVGFVNFSKQFPAGLHTVVAWVGDINNASNYVLHGTKSNTSNARFGFALVGAAAGSKVLVNYIAVGW